MYLKSLELHGFKSFPNRTVLNFERGATVVIGPNGSGKSNISDAMRWVLGEMSTKSIRGTKMEDVIFGGADTRRPMGFAEVTVVFDNTDLAHRIDSPYDEIAVTRRYYRSGDSEYFLNKKQVRLKDIHELFMNTGVGRDGYSIIGQGKISEILSKKSEDRRSIFEEAAGIAKYRYRKTESERKLAETEANMLRLSDLIGELEARVGPLEKDAEKARRYLELYEGKKRADVMLWLHDTENMNSEEERAASALLLSKHELEMAEDTVSGLERQYDKLFEDTQKKKTESERLLAEISEKDRLIAALESEYRVSENESEHTRALIGLAESSAAETKRALDDARQDGAQQAEAEKKVREDITRLETEFSLLAEKQQAADLRVAGINAEIAELLETINALENEASACAVRLGVLSGSLESDAGAEEKTAKEIAAHRAEAKKYAAEAEATQHTVDSYNEKAENAARSAQQLAGEREELEKQLKTLSDKAAAASARRDAHNERADALAKMEEHFEGYSGAVRTVMQDYAAGKIPECGLVFGPLSKLITVKPEHSTAIETAFAANIQNIVVDNESTAKAAIRYLKKTGGGRATFCPVSSVTPQDDTAELKAAARETGCIGYADTLVTASPDFSAILSRYLGRTLVFSDLDAAANAAKKSGYRIKLVTLDGQIITPGGSFTGGSVRADTGMLTRAARITELKSEAAQADGEYKQITEQRALLDDRLKTIDSSEKRLAADRELLQTLAGAERSSLDTALAKSDAAEGLAARLAATLESLHSQRESASAEAERLTAELADKKQAIAGLTERRAERYTALASEQEEKEALRASESEALIALAEKRRDAENGAALCAAVTVRCETLEHELESGAARTAEYTRTLEELENSRRRNRENSAVQKEARDALGEERSRLETDSGQSEQKQNELYRRIKDKNAEKEILFRAYTKNEEQAKRLTELRERLTEQLAEDYQLTYTSALALGYPKLKEDERADTAALQKKLKGQMKALGNVNVGAIDEYTAVRTRYDDLSGQYSDLVEAGKKLSEFIDSVEGEMKRRFIDTFERVNGYFGEVFAELFGGGHAELLLTDPENLLECGIDIKAAPPGKIVKSLSLLSGGEQAFVAIALFFAVLKVNPSPFCILDEIESALDEVNVARFADYIKKFSGDTQFILITHRRGTMEAADRMYGVTMPEQGVSKVIALNVGDFDTGNGDLGDGVF